MLRVEVCVRLLLTALLFAFVFPSRVTAAPAACPAPVRPLALTSTTSAGELTATRTDSDLQELVETVLDAGIDHYGVVVKDLRSNTTASVNTDKIFYAASLFKLPIMVAAFVQRDAGLLAFDDAIVATWDDVLEDLGTFPGDVGDAYDVSELLEMMITLSDNTSAIMLLRTLGGGAIDEAMASLGLTSTSVFTYDLPTSAKDMATLLETIVRGQAFGFAASNEMIDLMLRQTWRSRIPLGLPDDVPVGNKTGDWYDAAHDVAVVFAPGGTYVLAVLSDGGGSDQKIVELSKRVYDYYTACAASSLTRLAADP
jgi:beta-lactamase class A